ncbi:MAG: serine/threonine protein kinase [Planctomycetia bacterium]|nr:serine/threonine protein kinase [Planctomycetia bacterium]
MSEPAKSEPSSSSIRKQSRSTVGRVTGRVTRLLGGSTTMQATGRFLRRQLWVWPIVAAALLGTAGWWVSRSVENAMRQQRLDELNTILEADIAALRVWVTHQQANAEMAARDDGLLPMIRDLTEIATSQGTEGQADVEQRLLTAPAQAAMRSRMQRWLKPGGYVGFSVVGPDGLVLSSDANALVGKSRSGYRKEFFDRVLTGQAAVSKPFRSTLLLHDEKGESKANLPSMFAAAPIRDATGKIVGAVGLRIRPDDQFTQILQIARSGKTGETYAFDRQGLFLSESRFDDELKQIGLLVDRPDSRSILTLELRDPQANMPAGERPASRRPDQPLTVMAAAAVTGQDGANVDGYRDYRGVPVVGAWQWLDDYDFGVATEIDVSEAFRPIYILRTAFRVLMGLLILAATGIFLAMLLIARQQRALQDAAMTARQIGQYKLENKLGTGGMGTVYKARHAMLRRPTAIKLLDTQNISPAAVARFEREVQSTSALTHPNTVAVYDYGRTPEGIFYYAMEYLDGINLDDLVMRFGPLGDARTVHILRQVCGSLAEAHATGLIHRDIKPANIVLTTRGGMCDFVKVLDFGLVKSLDGSETAHLTSDNAVTGTPLYLAPEAVNHPELVAAGTDVYSIGAVAYFLLTGTPVFSGASVLDICMKHVQQVPEAPSSRLRRTISPDLERLVLSCLAKLPADRPTDAAELLRQLDACMVSGEWTQQDAANWWAVHGTLSQTIVQESAAAVGLGETPRFGATMDFRKK